MIKKLSVKDYLDCLRKTEADILYILSLSQSNSLRKQGTVLFISQILAFAIYSAASFVLVRLIPKSDFGVFQQFNLLITTIVPVVGFTLVSSLYYFYPANDEKTRKQFVLQTYFLLLIIGVLCCSALLFFKHKLLEVLKFDDLNVLPVWLFFSLAVFLVSSISDNIFILEKNNLTTILFFPLEKVAYFIGIVLIVVYDNYSFTGAIKGYFIYALIKFAFITYYINKHYGFVNTEWNFSTIKQQIKYCFPFFLANIAFVASNKFDKIMVNQFINPEDYAVYSVAFLSIPLLANLFSSVNNVTVPKLTQHLANQETFEALALYRKLVFTTSSIAIPAVIYFFVMAPQVITLLFTNKYESATPYYRIYLLVFFFTMTSYGLILRAAKRTKEIFYANILAAVITVAAGFPLIASLNMTGAIITAALATILPSVFQSILEMNLLKVNLYNLFPLKELLRIFLISLFPVVFIILISQTINSPLLALLASSTVYFPLVAFAQYHFSLTPFKDQLDRLKKKIG